MNDNDATKLIFQKLDNSWQSAASLAKLSGVSYAKTRDVLDELFKEDLVEKKTTGKTQFYTLWRLSSSPQEDLYYESIMS